MLFLEVITWWYGAGWREVIRRMQGVIRSISVTLSVSLLIKTLFSPWRQIVSYGDRSFVEGIKAGLDNAVSRMVGFSVRLLVLTTAGVLTVFAIFSTLLVAILWPLTPIFSITLLIWGMLK